MDKGGHKGGHRSVIAAVMCEWSSQDVGRGVTTSELEIAAGHWPFSAKAYCLGKTHFGCQTTIKKDDFLHVQITYIIASSAGY